MAFIPAFSEPQSDCGRGTPPRPSSANQGATRAQREFPLGDTPQSGRTGSSVTTMSSLCSLIVNRVVVSFS